jgi:tRNA(Ile2)-agmatinylcytidine synthase
MSWRENARSSVNGHELNDTYYDGILHIGFDDTDSREGKCTTHLAFRITRYLLENSDAQFLDYPLLIRLNPNIPIKTRGNGAVCLRIKAKNHDKIIQDLASIVEVEAAINKGANPGLVFLNNGFIPKAIKDFGKVALYDVLSTDMAKKIANEFGVRCLIFGNGQGLVGSLAAVGSLENGDYTYEVIAYRRPCNYGKIRNINATKVIQYDKKTFPNTFNNYDRNHRRVLIAPHGPDPVFCGIRGESPEIVISSLNSLNQEERLEGYLVFRSNQGTNKHLQNQLQLSAIKPFMAGYVIGNVISIPQVIQGGHVFFALQDASGFSSPVAVYEPTGLAQIASQLEIGDTIQLGCGVHVSNTINPMILNAEYISIVTVVKTYDLSNPLCKNCHKKMKSEGRNKGFQCDRCKYRDTIANKIPIPRDRNIQPGLYIPTPKSHRHLTKPSHRYGIEKSSWSRMDAALVKEWFRLM